jgi:uncharacterized membrane protein YfcA
VIPHSFFPAYFEWWHIPVVFLAGMIGEGYGSVIGGGGILLQSVQVFLGVPIKSAIANGNTGGLGTEAGIISETHRQIAANKKLAVRIAIPFTLGGIGGIWLLLKVSPDVIKYVMIAAVLTILAHAYYSRGRQKTTEHISKSQHAVLFFFMFLSGLYGSFIGPGEGAFSKFALMSVLGLTFIQSQGIKSVATVPSRIYSTVVTAIAGLIVWPYTLTLLASTFLGAKYATKVAKKIPNNYLMAGLTAVSLAFIAYLLFFY